MVFCVGVCGVCVSWSREEQQTCRVVREVNVSNTKCLRPACPGHFGTKQYRVYGVVIERRSAVYPQPTPAELRLSVVKPLPIFRDSPDFHACPFSLNSPYYAGDDQEISVLYAISHCEI